MIARTASFVLAMAALAASASALATLATPAALAAPASASAAARWAPDVAAARRWAAGRQGSIAFAVRAPEGVAGAGLDRTYPSASVIKAMLMVTYLRQRSVRDRPLRAADRALLAPMIRWSDNGTATRVRDLVGNDAVTRLARTVGMTRFSMAPVWGSARISPRDQTRFFLHVDAFVPRRHRAYAMRLLGTIVPAQRWGIARALPAPWTLAFKGGWGSGTGAVGHQVGLLRLDGDRVAIAVMTLGSPSHAYAKATEEGIARRLLPGLRGRLAGTASMLEARLPGRLARP
jgi:hypothetical protein